MNKVSTLENLKGKKVIELATYKIEVTITSYYLVRTEKEGVANSTVHGAWVM
jgi:hypothetical protein